MAEQLKLPEVARRLGVSEKTARRYIKSGKLPSVFIGGTYRVEEDDLETFLQGAKVSPPGGDSSKAPSRSSPKLSLGNGIEDERRKSKLSDVADMLLQFGEMLLLTWEAELPTRAQAGDDEWLRNIRTMWQAFGLINYGVLDELGPEGMRDIEGWFARYMDINASVHRLNRKIEGLNEGTGTVALEPLAIA